MANSHDDTPTYIAVRDLSGLDGLDVRGPVEVYAGGVSPYDWDEEDD